MRQRAMAQLRPVSIPEIVRDMAGSDPVARIQDFDRHYMPDGQPAPEASSRGTSGGHSAELKTNATGFRRSLSEVFALLTHGTASLEEAKKIGHLGHKHLPGQHLLSMPGHLNHLLPLPVLCVSVPWRSSVRFLFPRSYVIWQDRILYKE